MPSFANLFRRKPSWQFDARGTVWKLLCSEHILLGDVRDTDKKRASFFATDFLTGEVLWKNVALKEGWWIGMQAICDGILLLNGYEKPDMPLPKGIYALDCATGTVLWERTDLTYLFSYHQKIYVNQADFRNTKYLSLIPQTGDIDHDYGASEEDLAPLRMIVESESAQAGYIFPEYLQHHPDNVRKAIEKHADQSQVRGGIDAAEWNGLVVASWHEPARGAQASLNNIVVNTLAVIDIQTGKALYEDIPAANAPAPSPDTFFIKDGVLMYVKESSRVIGVVLKDLQR